MGIFSEDKSAKIQALQQERDELATKGRKVYEALVDARKRIKQLEGELALATAETVSAKRLAAKARKRQKASVERANRFKSKLTNLAQA